MLLYIHFDGTKWKHIINRSLESYLLTCGVANIVFLFKIFPEKKPFRPSDQRVNLPACIAVFKLVIIDVRHHKSLVEIVTIYSSFTHQQSWRASVWKYCIITGGERCATLQWHQLLWVKALKYTHVFPCKTAPPPAATRLICFPLSGCGRTPWLCSQC